MKSPKIPVSGLQQPLQNPFAALSSEGLPEGTCPAPPAPARESAPAKRPRVVLRREKSQRGGKTVTIVSQIPTHFSPPEIENLCREARKALGCGGTVEGREIELQGDQPERVRAYLEKRGFQVGGV
ncbi:MAG TPA: translation initiation factor [Terrimicrobiaceae bacterium]|nr:translation initiation factor [Terrimicrobiaceae bacterium]